MRLDEVVRQRQERRGGRKAVVRHELARPRVVDGVPRVRLGRGVGRLQKALRGRPVLVDFQRKNRILAEELEARGRQVRRARRVRFGPRIGVAHLQKVQLLQDARRRVRADEAPVRHRQQQEAEPREAQQQHLDRRADAHGGDAVAAALRKARLVDLERLERAVVHAEEGALVFHLR